MVLKFIPLKQWTATCNGTCSKVHTENLWYMLARRRSSSLVFCFPLDYLQESVLCWWLATFSILLFLWGKGDSGTRTSTLLCSRYLEFSFSLPARERGAWIELFLIRKREFPVCRTPKLVIIRVSKLSFEQLATFIWPSRRDLSIQSTIWRILKLIEEQFILGIVISMVTWMLCTTWASLMKPPGTSLLISE